MVADNRGFGLTELCICMAVIAVIMGVAIPSFDRIIGQWHINRGAQALVNALHLARSHATLRGTPVVLCQVNAAGNCAASVPPASGNTGWRVFAPLVLTSAPQRNNVDVLLSSELLPARTRVFGSRSGITYWPVARSGTTATFVLCDLHQAASPRAVIVSQTGRPRLSDRMPDGTLPDCGHG
jgi:type IV fimbrial biogenesis protein FimT